MLKQALACAQSHQSLHCSRTCAKWAYIRHILSVNAQTSLCVCEVHCSRTYTKLVSLWHLLSVNAKTSLTMRTVSPEPSLLSQICPKWAYIWHILSVNAQTSLSVCEVLPEPSLLSHMHKMGVHKAYFC